MPLYELVKNSVDAKSEWVSIKVQVVLKKSHFHEAKELIENQEDLSNIRQSLLNKIEPGSPARPVQKFRDLVNGANNYEQLHQALIDAYHDLNWIEVKDCGHGMSAQDLKKYFY